MPKKILVADDSVVIQKSIGITFSQEDFQVMFVGNGEEAYQKAKELNPDLILADTSMPKLSGAELCKKFRQNPEFRNTPLLLLTSSQESFSPDQLKAMGANDFIQKPFESSQLLDKVKSLFSNSPASSAQSSRGATMEKSIDQAFSKMPQASDQKITQNIYEFDSISDEFDSRPTTNSNAQGPKISVTPDILSLDEDSSEIQSVDFTPPPTPQVQRKSEMAPDVTEVTMKPVSSPSVTPPPAATVAPTVSASTQQIQLSEQQIEQIVAKVFQSVIERIAWEVVPDIAERLIKEEIQKLTSE